MTSCTETSNCLKGLSVLLVEDNFLNGIAIQQTLKNLGCHIVGPAASVTRGLELVANEKIDLAVLDINIIGGTVEPIAQQLQKNDRQFIFVTGYGSPQALPEPLKKFPRLSKPVTPDDLENALLAILN